MMKETQRLWLRSATVDDVDDLLEMQNDEVILKYNCMKPMNKEEMLHRIEEMKSDFETVHLVDKQSNKLIGSIFLEPDRLRYGVQSVSFSYHLNTKYTGKGLMSEAVQAMLYHWFVELQVELVTARVFSENTRSNILLQHLGFVQEGCLKHAVKAYRDVIYDDNLYRMSKVEYNQRYGSNAK